MRLMTLFLLLLTLSAVGKHKAEKGSLFVEGTARMKEIPAIMHVSVHASAEANTYSECQQEIMKALDATLLAFTENDFEKKQIKINDIVVFKRQNYNRAENTQEDIYSGNVSLTIDSVYTAAYSKQLVKVLNHDLLSITYRIDFKFSEEQKDRLRAEAVSLSIEEAKEKAQLIAQSSGVKLGKIKTIEYDNDRKTSRFSGSDIMKTGQSGRSVELMQMGDSQSAIDLTPNEIAIEKSIIIQWEITE